MARSGNTRSGPTNKWAGLVGTDHRLGLTPDALTQECLFPMKPQPSATTWVMRDQEGQMVPIKVTDMTDAHLYRWVQYFRRKYRETGGPGNLDLPDSAIDLRIRRDMVTAPAIYIEVVKRGIPLGVTYTEAVKSPDRATSKPVPQPGVRRITLDDEE